MINSRLFTTVRDSLGLTYDVSFELSLFDRLPSGWFHVNVTSTPQVQYCGVALDLWPPSCQAGLSFWGALWFSRVGGRVVRCAQLASQAAPYYCCCYALRSSKMCSAAARAGGVSTAFGASRGRGSQEGEVVAQASESHEGMGVSIEKDYVS